MKTVLYHLHRATPIVCMGVSLNGTTKLTILVSLRQQYSFGSERVRKSVSRCLGTQPILRHSTTGVFSSTYESRRTAIKLQIKSLSQDRNASCFLVLVFFVFFMKTKPLLSETYLILHTRKITIANLTLQKHAYSNILKILQPKNENFQIKKSDIFHISAQNIDCGYLLEPPRRGGSKE